MHTAGVLGGLGPETTARFYLKLISKCYSITKEARPPVLIWNIPLDYMVEEDLIERNTGEERYVSYMEEGARILEKGGADFIVIPCNTVHIYIEKVREAVSIPVLSIVEETTSYLKDMGAEKVGILATSKTLDHHLYSVAFEEKGIAWEVPFAEEQAAMGRAINNILLDRPASSDTDLLYGIIDRFYSKGINDVILACTDLQILVSGEDSANSVHDTMDILADAAVREILA